MDEINAKAITDVPTSVGDVPSTPQNLPPNTTVEDIGEGDA